MIDFLIIVFSGAFFVAIGGALGLYERDDDE